MDHARSISILLDQSTIIYQTTIASVEWTTINIIASRQFSWINDQCIVSGSDGEKSNEHLSIDLFQLDVFLQFELQQEDFPPLPHRSQSHDSAPSSSSHIPPTYQSQFSSSGQSNLSNGYTAPSQHPQSQSPVSFKSSIEPFSALISRHNKTSPLTSNATSTNVSTGSSSATLSQSGSTITDQYGLAGLLQMIQQAEKNPESSMLLNFDLTTLGLSRTVFFSFDRTLN